MELELRDGTIVQDGLNFKEDIKNHAKESGYIPFPIKAHVIRVFPIDDDQNREGETYVCDLHVPRFGMVLYKVPFLLDKADYDNYVHYSPLPAKKNLDFSLFDQTKLDASIHDGTVVLVQFINADVKQPVITKVFPHNLSGRADNPIASSPDPRPGNESDGDNYKIRYNGTNIEIDKDGNVLIDQSETTDLTANHDKKFTFKLANPLFGLGQTVEFEMDNTADGMINLTTTDILGVKQNILLDAGNQKTVITSENDFGSNVITLDPDQIEVKNEGVLNTNTVVLDDNGISFETTQGKVSWIAAADIFEIKSVSTTITIDGTSDLIKLKTAFGDELSVSASDGIKGSTPTGTSLSFKSGAVELEGTGGKMKLKGGKVAMGGAAAELLDLFDQTLEKLNTTLTQIQAIIVPTAVGPSGPPTNAAQFATLFTEVTTIKTQLGLIKGSL